MQKIMDLLICSAPLNRIKKILENYKKNAKIRSIRILINKSLYLQNAAMFNNLQVFVFDGFLNVKSCKNFDELKKNKFDNIFVLVSDAINESNNFKSFYQQFLDYENIEFFVEKLKFKKIIYIDWQNKTFITNKKNICIKNKLRLIDKRIVKKILLLKIKFLNLILPFLIRIFHIKKHSVLHLPLNIASVPSILSKGLAEKKIKSKTLILNESVINTNENVIKVNRSFLFTYDLLKRYFIFIYCLFNYSIFHYHFGETIFNEFNELKLIKKAGKKIVVHYHGCDIRQKSKLIKKYKINVCNDCEWSCSEIAKINTIKKFDLYADLKIVAIPDILEFVNKAEFLLNPAVIEIKADDSIDDNFNERIKVVHSASYRKWKGTDYLIEAVNKLNLEGYNIELEIIEDMPHKKALYEYQKADIAVDQLVHGWYGVFAIEMMLLGKIVISYIREDLLKYAESCPIINSNKDTIYYDLKRVIDMRLYKNIKLKQETLKYVMEKHFIIKVINKLIDLYKKYEFFK